jgi:hypothetical protein
LEYRIKLEAPFNHDLLAYSRTIEASTHDREGVVRHIKERPYRYAGPKAVEENRQRDAPKKYAAICKIGA